MRAARRILIVDDDLALRQSLAEQLELNGDFISRDCGSGVEALAIAVADPHDAVLLDVGLPDIDGRELCRRLRQAGVAAPIIMLTAADGEHDTLLGFDAGADDYVTKPFRLSVLLARLRAHLRRSDQSEGATLMIGPYTFRPGDKLLLDTAARRKVRLTEKETAILKYLYRAGDRPITRETLLGEVWGYQAGVSTHTLETHVYRLRQKIEQDPSKAEILITEPGGYRLVP